MPNNEDCLEPDASFESRLRFLPRAMAIAHAGRRRRREVDVAVAELHLKSLEMVGVVPGSEQQPTLDGTLGAR